MAVAGTADGGLVRLGSLFQLQRIAPDLSALADKVEKMELGLPSEAGLERLNDLGNDHVKAKDKKLVQTPGQTVLAAVCAVRSELRPFY